MTWEFKQIEPPGARGTFKPEMYKSGDFYAEEKLDGDRRIAQFCEDGVRFTGRRISDVDGLLVEKTENVPHLNGKRANPGIPYHPAPDSMIGTVLDGEMTVAAQGARSKDVTSIMGSLPAKAIAKQLERGWLVYVVFDVLFYKGEDLRKKPLIQRRRILRDQVLPEWNNPYVKLVPSSTTNTEKPEDMFLRILRAGGEGIILKDLTSAYGDEKAWVKVKKELTEDVVIVGFDPPEEMTDKTQSFRDENGIKKKRVLETSKSRLAANGWIGAIRFGQYKKLTFEEFHQTRTWYAPPLVDNYTKGSDYYSLTYCGSASGMDDATRKDLSENQEKYLGTVVEILANEREETGKFRHPRVVQFRDNKNPQDCIWGQK